MRSAKAAAFIDQHPGVFFLDPADIASLSEALARMGVLATEEKVLTASQAGEENMSCVARVKTSRRSLIVKQSRPWVENHPQLDAPWDRSLREAEFYAAVAGIKGVADRMPAMLAVDGASRLLVLEDLGEASTLIDGPLGRVVPTTEADELADFLSALHHAFLEKPPATRIVNREMREWNAGHVFRIPYQDGHRQDLDAIQPGLAAATASIRGDVALREAALRLEREVYLADGSSLLHGNFVPGSLLRTKKGLRVIDPEFGFMGRAEFDVGVCLAHFVLSSQSSILAERFLNRYKPVPDHSGDLVRGIAGVEIIRRLLGYAQLPLRAELERKMRWLHLARVWVLSA
ncbi:MAG: phosphotransferase [Verrucomicrobia bacterium]|nr:phosphotransferase [Verrucomicrobiota bacterium]MBI3868267.1 phosphotransferase [Verrucomicrobiota bacterium]